ncbi:AAA family ATPase [Streptomyces sp. NPDC057680]|uniref:AAA family ATPase n=1 Tax=Streptomyces sp. NPDC057680 TaxID=3346208 RepID=UPI0036C5848C
MAQAEVLLIAGRAGVGKTTVAWEVSAQLRAEMVAHCVIEGDFMGQVHPAPEGDPRRKKIAERNLTALWSNYAELGYHRLIYTHTVSVLAENEGMFRRAMGADVRIIRVALTASDATARERLTGRERGKADLARGCADHAGPGGDAPQFIPVMDRIRGTSGPWPRDTTARLRVPRHHHHHRRLDPNLAPPFTCRTAPKER